MNSDKDYRILVVDDAKDTQLLLEFDLTAAGYQVECCDSGEQGLLTLTEQKIDLMLLDMYMPGLSGLETLKKIKTETDTAMLPVIMLSASNDEDEIVTALELGAEDYVVKPYTAKILLARIRTAIRLKEKTQQLEYLAKTDFLTNINNRGNFFELSSNALNLANRSNQSLVVAMFDIDFFKLVNDDYGHDAGDKILIAFAQQLTTIFRDYDIIGRIGGEEFAVCLPNTCLANAQIACERLRQKVEQTNYPIGGDSDNTNQQSLNITVSIGLALSDKDLITIDDLLKQADLALYYAKEHGRNQVVNVSDINDRPIIESNDNTNDTLAFSDIVNQHTDDKTSLADALTGIDFHVGVNNVLGDEALFKEILIMFYQDHHLDGDKLELALQNQDEASVKHLAHTLKGVACSVGAMILFDKTKAFDLAINEKRTDEYDNLFAALLPELKTVMKSIAANLDIDNS